MDPSVFEQELQQQREAMRVMQESVQGLMRATQEAAQQAEARHAGEIAALEEKLEQALSSMPKPQQPPEPGFVSRIRILSERKLKELEQPEHPAGAAMRAGKLEPFYGEGVNKEGKEVMQFLDWVACYYAQPGRPTRSVLVSYLAGPALDWYNTVALQQQWDHDLLLWNLGVRFHNEGRQVEALQQLMQLRQGSSHIAQHNQRFQQLAVAAQKLDDSDIVVRYASSCGPAAQEVIRRHQLYTLPLVAVMQRVQQEVMMDQGFGAMMASVDVRGAAQQPARQQLAGPVPMELGVMRAQPGQGGQARGKCYECGGRGHIKASCPNLTRPKPGSSCFRCGGNGHFARDCSTPEPQQQPQHQPQGRFGVLRNHRPKAQGGNKGGQGAN
jgi:hypothetical protein